MKKTINNVHGAEINCQRFDPCPLCYGCRNYDSALVKCDSCYYNNKEYDTCNTTKHTEKALNLMLRVKNTIKL